MFYPLFITTNKIRYLSRPFISVRLSLHWVILLPILWNICRKFAS